MCRLESSHWRIVDHHMHHHRDEPQSNRNPPYALVGAGRIEHATTQPDTEETADLVAGIDCFGEHSGDDSSFSLGARGRSELPRPPSLRGEIEGVVDGHDHAALPVCRLEVCVRVL